LKSEVIILSLMMVAGTAAALYTPPLDLKEYTEKVQSLAPAQTKGTGKLYNVTVISNDLDGSTLKVNEVEYRTTTLLAIGSVWKVLQLKKGEVTARALDRPKFCGSPTPWEYSTGRVARC
jgi:hypothetical protein